LVFTIRPHELCHRPDHRERLAAARESHKVPHSPGPPGVLAQPLTAIRALAGHKFWANKISIAEDARVNAPMLTSHSRVTDSYLLALARMSYQGRRFAAVLPMTRGLRRLIQFGLGKTAQHVLHPFGGRLASMDRRLLIFTHGTTPTRSG
jgi:hypothetical protein